MNTTEIKRAKHTTENSLSIPKHVIDNEELTTQALGLYILIFNNENIEPIYKSKYKKLSGIGRIQFDDAWNKLIKLGFLTSERVKGGWVHNFNKDGVQ